MSMPRRRFVLGIQTNAVTVSLNTATPFGGFDITKLIFNPNYIVQSTNEYLIITNPFTIDFTINRGIGSQVNEMYIDIYNLSEASRTAIFQDMFPKDPVTGYRAIALAAGYDNLYTVFLGNVWMCTSLRKGPDIITRIHAMDGGLDIAGTHSFRSFPSGISKKDVVVSLIKDFKHLKQGQVELEEGVLSRGVVVAGRTYDYIMRQTDNNFFVDLELANAMNYNGFLYTKGPTIAAANGITPIDAATLNIPVIDTDSGLLEIPQRQESTILIHTMFMPSVIVYQLIKLHSAYQPQYNGIFKVLSIRHQGIISDAIGGALTSYFELQLNFDSAGVPIIAL